MAKTTERRKYPTVLRYPGGKSRIIYYLFRKNMLPENIKEYREGFLGGGSCVLRSLSCIQTFLFGSMICTTICLASGHNSRRI